MRVQDESPKRSAITGPSSNGLVEMTGAGQTTLRACYVDALMVQVVED